MAGHKRARAAFRRLQKREGAFKAEITTATSRRPALKRTKVFIGPKASGSYLGREAERMSEELDEVTPSAIYSTLPKVKHAKGVRVGHASPGGSELVVADLSGKLTPLKVYVEGAAFADTGLTDVPVSKKQVR